MSSPSFLFIYESKHPEAIEKEFLSCRALGLNISGLNIAKFLEGIDPVRELEFLYCARNAKLLEEYKFISKKAQGYDYVIIHGTLKLTPRFIKENLSGSKIIYWATDDPVSTSFATLPYILVSDYIFTQTPLLNEDESFTDYLSSLTDIPVFYQPFGYLDSWKNGKSDTDILENKRDIPISFVGSPSWRKDLLLDCKKYYGHRLKIYSRDWGFLRHLHYDFFRNGVLHYVPRAVNESDIYMRSDISINSNAYGGPSTSRTFHLPICGALQVCDFEKGLASCFEINRHVFTYRNLDSADLMNQIDILLSLSNSTKAELRTESLFHVSKNLRFSSLLCKRLENFV